MKQFLEKIKNWLALDEGVSKRVDEKVIKEEKPLVETPPRRGYRENIDPNNMKIIIVSDNHMRTEGLENVLSQHRHDTDYFLHCGDSNLEHDHELMKAFITVKGNTDYVHRYLYDETVKLPNGELIWITHGHNHYVNQGVDILVDFAPAMSRSQCPSIILYGHTHKVDVQRREDLLIINPGSISSPRDGIIRTYAKLMITPEAYEVTILDIKDHSVVKEFQFPK